MGALKTAKGQELREAEIERARCAWLLASDIASRALGCDVRIVMQTRGTVGRQPGADDTHAKARKIACYLASVVGDVTGARLSDASGIDRATIHQHREWVEDQRDDKAFDQLVDRLERTLLGMAVRVVIARLGDIAPELGLAS